MPGVFIGDNLSVMALNMNIRVEKWRRDKIPLDTDKTIAFLNWVDSKIVFMADASQPDLFPNEGPRVFEECSLLFVPLGYVLSQEDSDGRRIYPMLTSRLKCLKKTLSDIFIYPEASHIKKYDVWALRLFLLDLSRSALVEEDGRRRAIGNHC